MYRSANPIVDQQIQKVSTLITTARRLLKQGKSVDLSALEEKIDSLCALILKEPIAERQNLREVTQEILADLDGLNIELDAQHNQVTQQLQRQQGYANPLLAQEVSDDD